MSKTVTDAMNKVTKIESKIEKFSDLLESLSNTEDKKKLLWKEIYENALTDRENAGVLFTDLLVQSRGNSANHTMFGPIMSKYLERMAKSNDQILRLAELIAKEEENDQVNMDDIFNKIGE
jgi:transcription elongation GreA/GreB family factor